MAIGSNIEWTDASWNPIVGCKAVSPGCANCYAARMTNRLSRRIPDYAGLITPNKVGSRHFNGRTRWRSKAVMQEPLHWKTARTVFVCSMSDLFQDAVPFAVIDKVVAVMLVCRRHTFQVLTKRAARARRYFAELGSGDRVNLQAEIRALTDTAARLWHCDPLGEFETSGDLALNHIWVGVSIESQSAAKQRVPELLEIRQPAVRFVSCEPLLGWIDLGAWLRGEPAGAINWVIAGGETQPKCRPMHPDWARAIRNQCQDTGTPFFFKQWGEWMVVNDEVKPGDVYVWPSGLRRSAERPLTGPIDSDDAVRMRHVRKKVAGRLLDGWSHDAMPSLRKVVPV